jgi:outer membrane lipoprotein-sorting protein
MKRFFLTVLTFCLALPLWAASADEIIKEVQKKYTSIKKVTADYQQNFVWEMAGESVENEGKIWAKDGSKFRIDNQDQTIVTDGKTLWTLSKVNKQVMIDEYNRNTRDNPFIRSFMDDYLDNYKATLVREEKIDGRDHSVLELDAINPDEFNRKVTIWVDNKTHYMTRIIQTDINGNKRIYTFSDIQTGVDLDDDLFEMEIPQDYETVDMR